MGRAGSVQSGRVVRPAFGQFWAPGIILPVAALTLGGALMVYSATVQCPGGLQGLFVRHLIAALLGGFGAVVLAWLPTRALDDLSPLFYAASLALLFLVLLVGDAHAGARRWLVLGPVRLQPSEPAKIAFVLYLAHFLARKRCNLRGFWSLAGALLLIVLPFVLVLREPDLGTALTFPAIGLVMLLWGGLPWLTLFVLASPLVTVLLASVKFLIDAPPSPRVLLWIPFVALGVFLLRRRRVSWVLVLLFAVLQVGIALETPRLWDSLAPYQQARVSTFIYPERDPTGTGYQVIQSKIAIGSGCLSGQGFGRGSQKALSFLPRQHTDFIYSVVGEELGFLGGFCVLLLYGVLLLRATAVARETRSRFGSLVAVGVAALIFYHSAVNIAMTLGLAPVTGLPLPFLSFGGSFLVTSLAAVGLLVGVAARRREY
jgi:rod shape determining protein RodA